MKKDINTVPHRRLNILTGDWILVSPHRTKRPWQGKTEKTIIEKALNFDKECYLCPGNLRNNQEKNPDYTEPFSFVNDFPALLPDTVQESFQSGLLRAETESGICKVVCFSPDHSLTLPVMEVEEISKIVQLWKHEYITLGAALDINYVQIFENKGEMMGCSNSHPHGQIWSQRSLPLEILKKSVQFKDYWKKHKRSLLADYLQQELELDQRILETNDHFVALIPYWAVWPYEAMILPRKPYGHIGLLNEEEELAFAEIIKILTTKYDNLFKTSFPYSSGIHQQPTDGSEYPEWHFHMSFYPPLLRSATIKKFMVGYEMFAGPQRDITAEEAAENLRSLPKTHYSKSPR